MPIDQDPLNLIIAGVGGQGNILASEIVASAAVDAGYLVTVGETYGASQRGGSVMSHVRLSRREQLGPLIPAGTAAVILGFEPIEALRTLRDFGQPATRVILNSRPNYPVSVLSGEAQYPRWDEVLAAIQEMAATVRVVEATALAQQAGNALAANVVMVGCLAGSGLLPIPMEGFRAAVALTIPADRLAMNLRAFDLGVATIRAGGESWTTT